MTNHWHIYTFCGFPDCAQTAWHPNTEDLLSPPLTVPEVLSCVAEWSTSTWRGPSEVVLERSDRPDEYTLRYRNPETHILDEDVTHAAECTGDCPYVAAVTAEGWGEDYHAWVFIPRDHPLMLRFRPAHYLAPASDH